MPLTEKSIGKCKEAFALIEKGMTRDAALKQLKMGGATLYEYQKMNNLFKKGERLLSLKAHKFVDLVQQPTKPNNIAVIVCSVDTIKSVIAGLL